MCTRVHVAAVFASLGVASAVNLKRTSNLQTSPSFSLKLTNSYNVQYYGPFSVGEQTLPVIYDTGSFDVVMLSNLCESCVNILKYNNANSSSYVGTDLEYEHIFASGSANTKRGFENVHIGDTHSPYEAQHFPFWQVTKHEISAWAKADARFAGIVGLGHSDHVPKEYTPDGAPTATLLAAMSVDTFALCLERNRPSAPGHLTFGARHLLESASFQVLQVKGKSHWAVQMTQIQLEGSPKDGQLCNPSCGAIVDSGTSLIAAPPSAADFVAKLQAMVNPDCSRIFLLPVLRFELDGKVIELPPSAWVWRIETAIGTFCKTAFMTVDKSSDLGPVWILGMPFLRYYYTVFDRDANEIHVARSTATCEVKGAQEAPPLAGFDAKQLPGVTGFVAKDFEPMEGDLHQTMVPVWAMEKGHLDL